MRLYKVILLVNLAVGVGFLLGSLWSAQEVGRLRREATAVRREGRARALPDESWSVHGVVRVIAPDINRVIIDHEDIPGLMEGMTMSFEPDDPTLLNGLSPGDRVRFILQRRDERVRLVAIEKDGGADEGTERTLKARPPVAGGDRRQNN
jgi:Cu/Ag efflux protein CusF